MRGRILMLLLFAANAHNFLWVLGAVDEDKVTKQLNRMEMDEYMAILNIKSLISRILLANEKIAHRLEKLEQPQKETRVCESLQGIQKESQMTTIINKLQQLEQVQNENSKRVEEINSKSNNIFTSLEKNEATLELVKTQVQDSAYLIKLPECARWLQTQNLDRSNFFSAEGQHFYFNKTTSFNWNAARDWCTESGMQLAMLKTTRQMDVVAKELIRLKAGGWYWLDASDVGQPAGQFRWADGTLVDGTTWHDGKISKTNSDSNETTCVDFSTDYVNLTDDRCSHVGPILCQVPAALAACL